MLRHAVQAVRVRALSTTAVARKDLVQDLYLKELRGYKPPVVAKDAHVGVVKNYSKPVAPKAPVLPADIASELAAYDASEPQPADVPAAAASTFGEDATAGAGAAAFLELLEEDLPKPEEHHH